jgi:hypothetical protein
MMRLLRSLWLWHPLCAICGASATTRSALGDERGPTTRPAESITCEACHHDAALGKETRWRGERLIEETGV